MGRLAGEVTGSPFQPEPRPGLRGAGSGISWQRASIQRVSLRGRLFPSVDMGPGPLGIQVSMTTLRSRAIKFFQAAPGLLFQPSALGVGAELLKKAPSLSWGP